MFINKFDRNGFISVVEVGARRYLPACEFYQILSCLGFPGVAKGCVEAASLFHMAWNTKCLEIVLRTEHSFRIVMKVSAVWANLNDMINLHHALVTIPFFAVIALPMKFVFWFSIFCRSFANLLTGSAQTFSSTAPCHSSFRQCIQQVKLSLFIQQQTRLTGIMFRGFMVQISSPVEEHLYFLIPNS